MPRWFQNWHITSRLRGEGSKKHFIWGQGKKEGSSFSQQGIPNQGEMLVSPRLSAPQGLVTRGPWSSFCRWPQPWTEEEGIRNGTRSQGEGQENKLTSVTDPLTAKGASERKSKGRQERMRGNSFTRCAHHGPCSYPQHHSAPLEPYSNESHAYQMEVSLRNELP